MHEKKHKGVYIHNCDKCQYGTNNKQSMESHVIKHHTSKEDAQKLKTYDCDKCQKKIYDKTTSYKISSVKDVINGSKLRSLYMNTLPSIMNTHQYYWTVLIKDVIKNVGTNKL